MLLKRLQKTLLSFLAKNKSKRFCVGFSGGVDSHVLLHMLVQLPFNIELLAIHVNHGWHEKAASWADHCKAVCQKLFVPYQVIHINAHAKCGTSLEAWARQVRYEALMRNVKTGDCLLTAHHQDDQAETLLLQLFRGAGPKGLASMPLAKWKGSICHLRPLLTSTRDELLTYAKHHQLVWIEDPSNLNSQFDRNFIRLHFLPQARQRWPKISSTIARTAAHCAESVTLLEYMAREDCLVLQGKTPDTLSICRLLALDIARRHNALRYWLARQGLSLPTQKQLEQLDSTVLLSKAEASPKLSWTGGAVCRYRDDLYALAVLVRKVSNQPIRWNVDQSLFLPAIGILISKPARGKGIRHSALLAGQNTVVSFRQGGERFHPIGRQGSHPLKKLFQEWKIPVWDRPYVPLIYGKENQLLAVAGYAIAHQVQVGENEKGIVIDLIKER